MDPAVSIVITVVVLVLIVIQWQYRLHKIKANAAEGRPIRKITPGLWIVLAVVVAFFIFAVVVLPLV